MIVMLAKKELVGHARNVVADNYMTRRHLRKLLIGSRHRAGRPEVVSKEFLEALDRAVAVLGDFGPLVNMRKQKALELSVLRPALFAEPGHANSRAPDIVYRSDAGIHEQPFCRADQIGSQLIEDALQCFVEFELLPGSRMGGVNLCISFAKERNFFAKNNQIDELGLKRRAHIQKVFGKLRKFGGGIIARMLDDAFANFKREIQAGKIKVALLELFDDTERAESVIETDAPRE